MGLQKTSPVPEDDSAARCAVWAPEGHVGSDPFLLLAPRLGSPLSGSKTSSAGLADGNFTSIGSAGSDEPTAGRRPSSAEGIRRRVGFICSPLQGPPALPLTVLIPWGIKGTQGLFHPPPPTFIVFKTRRHPPPRRPLSVSLRQAPGLLASRNFDCRSLFAADSRHGRT